MDGYGPQALRRELIQNADDANAVRLEIVVLEQGLNFAHNSLLRGPALIVANDGPFPTSDRDALHQALGGSKAEDPRKIGRFGVGLKSVFHLCEAFVYLGSKNGNRKTGAVNPWAGTGEEPTADPLHPDWDTVDDHDLRHLTDITRDLAPPFCDGLLLWIPLRLPEHLNRSEGDLPKGLGTDCPSVDSVVSLFHRPESLALLIAQCRHLCSIKVQLASSPECMTRVEPLTHVTRTDATWVGRHDDDRYRDERTFRGTIRSDDNGDVTWTAYGIDAVGLDSLRDLRSRPDWPKDERPRNGRLVSFPRKALAHAAVTVLYRDSEDNQEARSRCLLRWAAFLPLNDGPDGSLVETLSARGTGTWDIVLHGYFWPSQDRRSIPGVTSDDDGASEETRMRTKWNRTLRDDLLLPLLPRALETAVEETSEDVASELVEAVANAASVQQHLESVTRSHVLLPVLTATGVCWKACVAGTCVLSLPSWKDAPHAVRETFTYAVGQTPEVLYVNRDAPGIGAEPSDWTVPQIEIFLNCISSEALGEQAPLAWVAESIRHLLGPQPNEEESAAVARWIAKQIGEGALQPAIEGPADTRKELRQSWLQLFSALPKKWHIHTPVESARAVAELAIDGGVGPGLLPIPFGVRPDTPPIEKPVVDQRPLDTALRRLGERLSDPHGAAQTTRRSRLLLAEILLSARSDRQLPVDIAQLPVLRAIRLPEAQDEAWRAADLRQESVRRRVLARSRHSEDPQPDHTRAATELAQALGESVWLVDGATASKVNAPPATSKEDLAHALLCASVIETDPVQRRPLLNRLALGAAPSPAVRRALRILITGSPHAREECDIYLPRGGDGREHEKTTLTILLKLLRQEWRAAENQMVQRLPHVLFTTLRIRTVDAGVLQDLLDETLQTNGITWSELLKAEREHLLRHLYGSTAEDHDRWRKMPLHRYVTGERRPIGRRTLRVTDRRRPPRLDIQLLDPDTEVEDMYQHVRLLDDDGILKVMLQCEQPDQYAHDILNLLRSNANGKDMVNLPRYDDLLSLLRTSKWLPSRDANEGSAPEDVLILPEQLRQTTDPLVGALGRHRLPDAIPAEIWERAEEVVHEIIGRPGPVKQIRRLVDALDFNRVCELEGGSFLILSDPNDADVTTIVDVIQCPVVGCHAGWKIVKTAAISVDLSTESGTATRGAVVALARSLSAPVPAEHQVSMLASIANVTPSRDSHGGRAFRCLLQSFARADTFISEVLPRITLPTQDGHWRRPEEIARSPFGVARSHRLVEDLCIKFDPEIPGTPAEDQATDHEWKYRFGPTTDFVFRPYFKAWNRRIAPGAVGAFLSLMGNGNDRRTLKLTQEWLGDDVPVASVRRALGCEERCAGVKVYVTGARYPNRVKAANLLGEHVEMAPDDENETVFATEPKLDRTGDYWHVELRDVEPSTKSHHELTSLLGKTVEWWALRVLAIPSLDRVAVRTWWKPWGTGSQSHVAPVRASILANLPLTLRQLGVKECGSLHNALTHATRVQRRREQAPSLETIKAERAALNDLAQHIEEPAHQRFLLDRVRKEIEQSGYQADSVLLELVQNADDALAQAAEIAGTPLPSDARRVVVRVNEHDGQPTIDLKHYGRPINDTGGVAFAAEHDHEWDQDLYFMMLMNLSGKPGETVENTAAGATTGLFGLGFKSVHLVTETPSVVSGLIAFSIIGGLLPKEQELPNDPEVLAPIDGHRATRIRLPLRGDLDLQGLTEQLMGRFRATCALLPAFARATREIYIEGGRHAAVSTFDAQHVDGAPGWSIGKDTTDLPGHGTWRLLRFRPCDSGGDTGTSALLVGLRGGMPGSFPSELPFLWNVTPTKEYWECGYAVSGPFKLDHGRTRVDLDHGTTKQAADRLGEALGAGLVQLHDALNNGVDPTLGLPTDEQGVSAFVTTLWKVLASGIDNRDGLRGKFLLSLHGEGRGISVWMNQRPVVPTELHPPFRERLPPLHSDTRIEQAAGGLDGSDLCHALSSIDGLKTLAQEHWVVSGHLAQLLRPLRTQTISRLHPATLLTELVERWDNKLTPERLHALRPLAHDGVWRLCADDVSQQSPWYASLEAQSTNGAFRPLCRLLLSCNPRNADSEIEDELLRAAFAPDEDVLDPAYAIESDDMLLFRRLRGRHRSDSETMTRWFADLDSARRRAALRYLLDGSLRGEILDRLLSGDRRPEWLKDYNYVCQTLGGEDDSWQVRSLLIALFRERFKQDQPPPPPPPDFFARFQNWWDDEILRENVIGQYEKQAWPPWLRERGIGPGLYSGSDDHWLALLVLGACRGLGHSNRKQHRNFLQLCFKEGWWEVFKDPDPSRDRWWMEVLRARQDLAIDRLDYSYWMSLFPAIYQCSRYLDVYRRVLRTAGRRPPSSYRIEKLFTPRLDPALGGSGANFDAPPFPLDIGRHWIMRELVRLGVVRADHLVPDCWVPSRGLISFLSRFGFQVEDRASNPEKAQSVSGFLRTKLQDNPHLCYCFDIPFLYVAANENLRRDLGYE